MCHPMKMNFRILGWNSRPEAVSLRLHIVDLADRKESNISVAYAKKSLSMAHTTIQ